ncbi:MAG TPA: TadE/TadG family type IV pilus assembly protein [Streptosporangiaceae bacterium]|jgi:Flp pilus assembly protein TadG
MTALSRTRQLLKRWRVELSDDRGVSAIELAILGPVLLIVITLIIQWALWFEAREVALDAAQAGAQYAREQQAGWAENAVSHAKSFYQDVGTSIIKHLQVSVNPPSGNPNQVFVTVSGSIPALIPGFSSLSVHETSGGDVECFRSAASGGQQCG